MSSTVLYGKGKSRSGVTVRQKNKNGSLVFESDFKDFNNHHENYFKRERCPSSDSTTSSIDSDTLNAVYAELHFGVGGTCLLDDEIMINNLSSQGRAKAARVFEETPFSKEKQKKGSKFKNKKIMATENEDFMVLDSDCETDSDTSVGSKGKFHLSQLIAKDNPWKLIDKDLTGRGKNTHFRARGVKCDNCRQKGHLEVSCPQPKRHSTCYLCGSLQHLSSKCPSSLCPYCFESSHRRRPCRQPSGKRPFCSRCYMSGHNESLCPEVWRQFHNTTSHNAPITRLKCQRQSRSVYCCLCADAGHFAFECTKPKPHGTPLPFSPLISVYNDKELKMTRLPKRRASSNAVLLPGGSYNKDSSRHELIHNRRFSTGGELLSGRMSHRDNSGHRSKKLNERESSPEQFLSNKRRRTSNLAIDYASTPKSLIASHSYKYESRSHGISPNYNFGITRERWSADNSKHPKSHQPHNVIPVRPPSYFPPPPPLPYHSYDFPRERYDKSHNIKPYHK